MTICPCCGFKSDFVLSTAANGECRSCGAQPVGEPLPRPDHELPSYGRSLLVAVIGALMVVLFLVQTFSAFAQKLPTAKTSKETVYLMGAAAFDFRALLTAAQTAAWSLKWVAIPMTILVLWGCRRLYRSIQQSPSRFCGLRYARRGYLASAAVPLMILILIGMTVPKRLHQRQLGIEAGNNAVGYQTDRVLLQYQKEFGTFPSEMKDLARLPDPDGSIANLLKTIDAAGYKPSAEVAAVPTKKPRPLRGAVISKASLDTGEPLNESLSFTNYELRLPGYDKLMNTDDDLILRDGVYSTKGTDAPRRGVTTAAR